MQTIDVFLSIYAEEKSYSVYLFKKFGVGKKELVDFDEGCLSFAGESIIVKRPDWIKLEYQDHKGNTKREILDGLNARVCLHEYDHLKGITFHQRVNNTDIPEELLYVTT